jgi:predicted permease
MSWIDGAGQRIRMLFRRASVEREMADELEFHLAQEAAQLRAAGMAPDDALRKARLSLGAGQQVQEEVRDEWRPRFVAELGADFRDALRQLARRPGFSAVAVLTLALGMGANTAIFSLVRSVLVEPLPYRDPARLAMVWRPTALEEETWLSAREYLEYGRALGTLESLAAYTDFEANLTEDGEPERVRAGAVTATLFGTLGARPALGRVFSEDEDVPGASDVVVVGDRLWRQRFGAEASIVGSTIRVNGRPRTVVGVMPPEFRLPMDYRVERPTELWVPAAIDATQDLAWGNRSFHLVGRLRPEATLGQASAEVGRVTAEWSRLGHVGSVGEGYDRAAVPLGDLVLGEVRPALRILFGAVGLVLLIACANVAHLLLARSDVPWPASLTNKWKSGRKPQSSDPIPDWIH